jgi:ABC-type sugar transport systems, permease components
MTDAPLTAAADRLARATPEPVARRMRGLSDRAIAWLFVGPTIFLLLAINIFPLIWTVNLSFTNFRANRAGQAIEYIGTRNYERLLAVPTSGGTCTRRRISWSGP